MQLKTMATSKNNLEIQLEGEDHSIAEILRLEILGVDDVVFSGVAPAHPLLRRSVMKLQTARRDPLNVAIEGGKNAVKFTNELVDIAKGAVNKAARLKEK